MMVYFMENPTKIRMITRGTPILGNHHIMMQLILPNMISGHFRYNNIWEIYCYVGQMLDGRLFEDIE